MAMYDPTILAKFADQLYSEAASIIVRFTLLGFLGGGVIGLGTGVTDGFRHMDTTMGVAAVFAVIAGLLGYFAGSARAFALKVQAQQLLCQLQIEVNTRSAGAQVQAAYSPAQAAYPPPHYPQGGQLAR